MKFAIRDRFLESLSVHIRQDLDIREDNVAEVLGIDVEEFNKILKKEAHLGLEIIAKFLMAFPEISPDWLIMGWGDPLRKFEKNIHNTVINQGGTNSIQGGSNAQELIEALQKLLISKEEHILALKRENELLREKI